MAGKKDCVSVLVEDEKKNVQIKLEQVFTENKTLKSENSDLTKDLKISNSALKSSQKETKEAFTKYKKKLKALQLKLKELNDYRIDKAAEEKSVRNKQKKLEKKEKSLKEKKALLEVEKMQFKRIRLNIDNTRSFVEVGTFTDDNEILETTLKVHVDVKDEVEAEPKSALEDAADIQANLSNDQSTSSNHSELTVLPLIPPPTLDQSLNLIAVDTTIWNPLNRSSMNSHTSPTTLNTSTVDSDSAIPSSFY